MSVFSAVIVWAMNSVLFLWGSGSGLALVQLLQILPRAKASALGLVIDESW